MTRRRSAATAERAAMMPSASARTLPLFDIAIAMTIEEARKLADRIPLGSNVYLVPASSVPGGVRRPYWRAQYHDGRKICTRYIGPNSERARLQRAWEMVMPERGEAALAELEKHYVVQRLRTLERLMAQSNAKTLRSIRRTK
jgi:hypothetical protein